MPSTSHGPSKRVLPTPRFFGPPHLRHGTHPPGKVSLADGHRYGFGHLRLAPHRAITVHTRSGLDTRRDVYQGSRAYVWDNGGDTATLRDDRGHLVDHEYWGHHHWP
ncbi:lamin tail domain-containing protein [Streptomyces sp. NPDC001380]|uniref:lamin tail domain-containing protein n=1 Tax=Streptomyces sp. NPDC001380 TaxID=3364566 RepID=UPI003687F9B8